MFAGLSLSGGGRGFSPVAMNVAPGYFHRKTEEKWDQEKSLAVIFPAYLSHLPSNLKLNLSNYPWFVFSQCVSRVVYHLHGHTIRFTVWTSGKQNSVLVDVVPESRLPFVQISFIYRKTAAKTLKWYQGLIWRKETRPEKQKTLFRHSFAPGNFPLKFFEQSSGVPFTGSFQLYFCKR